MLRWHRHLVKSDWNDWYEAWRFWYDRETLTVWLHESSLMDSKLPILVQLQTIKLLFIYCFIPCSSCKPEPPQVPSTPTSKYMSGPHDALLFLSLCYLHGMQLFHMNGEKLDWSERCCAHLLSFPEHIVLAETVCFDFVNSFPSIVCQL